MCETGEIIEKVFGVLTHQLRDMRRMMQSHGVSEVTMESTAVQRTASSAVSPLLHCVLSKLFIEKSTHKKVHSGSEEPQYSRHVLAAVL